MRKFSVVLLILFVLISLVSCSEYSPKGSVHVICVGHDYVGSDLAKLKGPVNDSSDMGACLKAIYDFYGIDCDVKYLLSSSSGSMYPTADNILSCLNELEAKAQDLVVFFFSGHGETKTNAEKTEIYSVLGCASKEEGKHTILKTSDVAEILASKGCRTLMILDACYNGANYENGEYGKFKDVFATLFNKVEFSNVAVMASSAINQSSFDGKVFSKFSGVALKALGWDTDARTTSYIPCNLTLRQLYSNIMSSWESTIQTPCMNFNELDLVLVPKK